MNEAPLSPSLEQDLQQLLARGEADAALSELERHYPELRGEQNKSPASGASKAAIRKRAEIRLLAGQQSAALQEMRSLLPTGDLDLVRHWVDLLLKRGRWQDALDLLSDCPDYSTPEIQLLEGLCWMAAGDRTQALPLFTSASTHPDAEPDTQARATFILLMERGLAKVRAGDPAAALEAYQQASALRTRLPGPYVSMGNCQRDLGDLEAAAALAREALKRAPNFAEAYYLLSNCGRPDDAPALAENIDEVLNNPGLREQDRILLLFAQGRLFKYAGNLPRAFDSFAAANALRAAKQPFDYEDFDRQIDFLIQTFSKEILAQSHPGAHDRDGLIFIIGMPRSGTTLCEQILAAHPDLFGGGELGTMNRLLAEITERFEWAGTDLCNSLDPDLRTNLADRYLDSLHPESGSYPWHTDKMPFNFLSVGLIAHLFPRAKFLLCRRHPYDIALSIMEQNFTEAHPFALSVDRTAHFMLGAQRLTRHWHHVLPDRFHTVSYEALAGAPDQEIPQLLDKLGLPWNENCLAPEKEKRAIQTASALQVRQPIYTTSTNRWQRYSQEQLAPLLEVLPAPDACDEFWPGTS